APWYSVRTVSVGYDSSGIRASGRRRYDRAPKTTSARNTTPTATGRWVAKERRACAPAIIASPALAPSRPCSGGGNAPRAAELRAARSCSSAGIAGSLGPCDRRRLAAHDAHLGARLETRLTGDDDPVA